MFRRRWSGLPKGPVFPMDMTKLGYFVNDIDEIRSIQDPKYYYKYFIDKHGYWNDSQRFAFHTCVENLIHDRLAALGLGRVRLPLGASENEPHVPVLATDNLATAERVVLFVGETAQDLGVLAYRVVGGPGGINQGSLVSTVQKIQEMPPFGKDVALIVLNPGQLFWWPEGRRALSLFSLQGIPRPSAAHELPRKVRGQNYIPGHADVCQHVASALEDLLGSRLAAAAEDEADHVDQRRPLRISAIGLAGGADALQEFLDQEAHWKRWGPHMDSLALVGGLREKKDIRTPAYEQFLRKRARAYVVSTAPTDTPLAGPDGNDQTMVGNCLGCPVYSSSTTWLTEMMFIDAQDAILTWIAAVARDPQYENPNIEVSYADKVNESDKVWGEYVEKEEEEGEVKEKEEHAKVVEVDEDGDNEVEVEPETSKEDKKEHKEHKE